MSALRSVSDGLDRVDRALGFATPGGFFRTELSALVDLEACYIDQHPPGLIFGGDDSFVSPRLSLFLDTHVGRHLYSLVEARVDRGFDPRSRSTSARFDEYLVRYTPREDARVNVQVGKFATVVGNWVARHDSWQNPFITAPLPYENVTTISDTAAPQSADGFLARRAIPDRKREWVPVIWGPSYTSGAAVFGRLADFDYAFEVKNAALAARPAVWDGRSRGWRDPTFSGRLGWRPAPAWSIGVSGSSGAYFRRKARATLPPGRDLDDFNQQLAGIDVTSSSGPSSSSRASRCRVPATPTSRATTSRAATRSRRSSSRDCAGTSSSSATSTTRPAASGPGTATRGASTS